MEEMFHVFFRLSVHTGAFEKLAVMAGRLCSKFKHLVETLFVMKALPLETIDFPTSMSQSIVIMSRSPSVNSEHGCSYPALGNAVTKSSVVTTRK